MRTMKLHKFGNPNADIVLIQPVDDHDLEGIENEVSVIAESCGRDFFLLACQVEDWNKDLSPWKAPAVFGTEDFGGDAESTMQEILNLTENKSKTMVMSKVIIMRTKSLKSCKITIII